MTNKEAALGLALAVVAAGTLWTALAMQTAIAELRGLAGTRDHNLRIYEAPTITTTDMSKIHRQKVVNGETITLICCQMEGETFAEFLKRCNEEWAALCRSVGG